MVKHPEMVSDTPYQESLKDSSGRFAGIGPLNWRTTAIRRKRQFAAPTIRGILTIELVVPAMTAVVTKQPLAATALS